MQNNSAWGLAKEKLCAGDIVECNVTHHAPYGIFVGLLEPSVLGIIERIGMEQQGLNTPQDYPLIDSNVRARVLGFREYNKEVELSLVL